MIKFIKNFRKDEDGAVTVDWVVLTAAIVGLAAVAYTSIGQGTGGLSERIGTEISGTTVQDITTDFSSTSGG
ncbi:hypothetical protein RUE5091_02642 [Ruegeria denitrificans]|uniref:Flp pilus assembly protein, pilin Flp n=1 Tax=Ruegeria denitrificans TaxID=1715692 RepID=A0A0P1IC67_9RHOB|nr:hypothetical protein [Ruegeria denitrificans]CUK04836.1 hypothetical protein RUE5091_02642 [Ruegeria denitrificans]